MKRPLRFALIVEYLTYLLVRVFERVVILIPESLALTVGRTAGRLVFILMSDRRKAAIENLTIAYGREKSSDWIRVTARRNFEHIGMSSMEFFRIRRWSEEEMARRLVVDGRLDYNLLMSSGNHGVIILNSHFGTFEVGATLAKWLGWDVHLIVTPLRNPFLSRYLFNRGGEDTGIKTYGHKGVVKDLIRLLRSGEMVAFLADQRGDAERGVFVNYFGSMAPANEVFAKIAIEGKARVLPLATYRGDDGRYYSKFFEEVPIEPTGDKKADLIAVSQRFHDLFEEWVRSKPEQGFWVHRKWRRKRSRRHRRKRRPTANQ
jgi:KDO2-lipid IV(A) lauroyltransferase